MLLFKLFTSRLSVVDGGAVFGSSFMTFGFSLQALLLLLFLFRLFRFLSPAVFALYCSLAVGFDELKNKLFTSALVVRVSMFGLSRVLFMAFGFDGLVFELRFRAMLLSGSFISLPVADGSSVKRGSSSSTRSGYFVVLRLRTFLIFESFTSSFVPSSISFINGATFDLTTFFLFRRCLTCCCW